MTRARCSGCNRPMLVVHGAERCCNVGCPGDPQTQLLQDESGGLRAAPGGLGRTSLRAAPDTPIRTCGPNGSAQ